MEMWLRKPTSKNPTAECFYDEKEDLVDEGHEYSWCGGIPNQFGKDFSIEHTLGWGIIPKIDLKKEKEK